MIYSQYQTAVGHLERLLQIEVYNPVNCLLGVCKKLKIPKKLSYEAAERYKAVHNLEPATAHDIYYGISEVVFMLQTQGASGSKVAQMEEIVARALSIGWTDYDIPGEFKW